MSGHGFWLRSAFPGWPAPRFSLACVFARVAYCVRRVHFPPPSGEAACGVGVVPPPLQFFFQASGGGMWFSALSSHGFVGSAAAFPGLGYLGLCPPFPFRLGCALVFSFPARHFSSGVCPVGRCSRLPVTRVCRVVLRCSFGGPLWCHLLCCLSGGFARLLWSGCAALWLCVFLLPPPLFLFVLFVCFPLFLSCGGSASSSPCHPWASARIGRHSVWLTGLLLVLALGWAVPRPHGSGGLCTRLAWWPVLSG